MLEEGEKPLYLIFDACLINLCGMTFIRLAFEVVFPVCKRIVANYRKLLEDE